MSTAANELARVIDEYEGVSAADEFANVIEEYINFDGTAEDYFASILNFPTPLRELYAALIFNSNVRWDGLPFAIVRYDKPLFMESLRKGLALLGELKLFSFIERACEHLRSDNSAALESETPNVAFDQEVPALSNENYFSENKSLMDNIGSYLRHNREQVLTAASQLGGMAE